MASEIVRLDSVDAADETSPKHATTDPNSNDILDPNSVESGFVGDDDDLASSGAAGSLSGSVSSLTEPDGAAAAGPTEEERQAWMAEIAKIDEEAATLRSVLRAKLQRAGELKKNLGITEIDEFKADVNYALKTIKESDAYAKTTATLSAVTQKTAAAVSSAVGAFKGARAESAADPGPEKISNTIFRDASGKVYVALNVSTDYVSRTVESVKSSPTVQAVGASVNSSWMKLKARVVGGGEIQRVDDSFIGDVVDTESSA